MKWFWPCQLGSFHLFAARIFEISEKKKIIKNPHFAHFWAPGPIGNDSSCNFRSSGPGPICFREFSYPRGTPGVPRGYPGGSPDGFAAKKNSKSRSDFDFFFVRYHTPTKKFTKSDGTETIRSEIARGIVSNRPRGPEIDKMRVFQKKRFFRNFENLGHE